jgi:chemotaxis protein CheD
MIRPVNLGPTDLPQECLNVPIGQWKLAKAPVGLRSILGSCIGVVLYDRLGQLGGLAHILLPDSRGSTDHPGRYANTAVPAMVDELCRLRGPGVKSSLQAKIAGGAKMFETQGSIAIGEANHLAVRHVLDELKIAIVSSDIGGETGRNIIFNTKTGRLFGKRPGEEYYEI